MPGGCRHWGWGCEVRAHAQNEATVALRSFSHEISEFCLRNWPSQRDRLGSAFPITAKCAAPPALRRSPIGLVQTPTILRFTFQWPAMRSFRHGSETWRSGWRLRCHCVILRLHGHSCCCGFAGVTQVAATCPGILCGIRVESSPICHIRAADQGRFFRGGEICGDRREMLAASHAMMDSRGDITGRATGD